MTLSTAALSIGFGSTSIIDTITLTFKPGTLYVMLGANGAGKTTLLRTLAGLQSPLAGSVQIDGRELSEITAQERARLIAYVRPLEHELPVANLTVREVVQLGRAPHHPWWSWQRNAYDQTRAATALARCALTSLAQRTLDQLSSGELQRVWLAMALVQEPKILLLDEPISRLDLRYALEVLVVLREIAASGVTVCASIHDISLGISHADEIVLLGAGEVLVHGEPRHVLSDELLQRAYQAPLALREVDGQLWVRVVA